jgi:hypothetical protein
LFIFYYFFRTAGLPELSLERLTEIGRYFESIQTISNCTWMNVTTREISRFSIESSTLHTESSNCFSKLEMSRIHYRKTRIN